MSALACIGSPVRFPRRRAGGVCASRGRGVFYQAPLYPYFLAGVQLLVGHDAVWIHVAQAVVGSISCGLIFLAGKAFFSRPAGVIAGVLLALYAPAIFFDGIIQKSVLD